MFRWLHMHARVRHHPFLIAFLLICTIIEGRREPLLDSGLISRELGRLFKLIIVICTMCYSCYGICLC